MARSSLGSRLSAADGAASTPDGRYVVIGGRRWRATDPLLPDDAAAALRGELMAARRAVGAALRAEDGGAERAARARVHAAKTALGERGTPWWEQTPEQRRARWEAGLTQPLPEGQRRDLDPPPPDQVPDERQDPEPGRRSHCHGWTDL